MFIFGLHKGKNSTFFSALKSLPSTQYTKFLYINIFIFLLSMQVSLIKNKLPSPSSQEVFIFFTTTPLPNSPGTGFGMYLQNTYSLYLLLLKAWWKLT